MTDKKPGRIKNFFQKKRLWYVNKKTLLREFSNVTRIANLNIESALKTLESMEQNKIYFFVVDGWSFEDISTLQDAIERAKKQLSWTSPKILFINKQVDKLLKHEIDDLIEKYKLIN